MVLASHTNIYQDCLEIITNGLSVIIEGFCIILVDIKGIALLFEALCLPVYK